MYVQPIPTISYIILFYFHTHNIYIYILKYCIASPAQVIVKILGISPLTRGHRPYATHSNHFCHLWSVAGAISHRDGVAYRGTGLAARRSAGSLRHGDGGMGWDEDISELFPGHYWENSRYFRHLYYLYSDYSDI